MVLAKFRFSPPKKRSVASRQESKIFGESGEQIASHYLEEQGCVILDRHYRKGHREVDIIALDHGELAIIEVKTRSSDSIMQPEEAVNHQKRQNIIWVANNYVRRYSRKEPLRFDIIAIVHNENETRIKHIKNAFNILNY